MANLSSSSNNQSGSLITTILWTGFITGTLDAAGAIINYLFSGGDNPVKIFQYIASGVFGVKAFSGKRAMVYWGLLFHFLIAYAFTVLFFLVVPHLRLFSKNKIFTGVLYGLFIWLVMNLLVLPLTHIPKTTIQFRQSVIGIITLIIAVGIPVSFLAHAFYSRK